MYLRLVFRGLSHLFTALFSGSGRLLSVMRPICLVLVFAAVVLTTMVPVLADPPPPPPAPSASSTVGQTVTNPVTSGTTTVSGLLVDPAGTPTPGAVAFVQTADGYTFLVKTSGQTFYNSDVPPVAFQVTGVAGNNATVTSAGASGPATFPVGQTTAAFDTNFNSSGTPGTVTPPVNVSGPNGVRQVIVGNGGSNGRDGALFVPPSSGGNGAAGPAQTVTLSSNVNATSNIGWEVGSVGGSGGNGGDSYLSFWDGRDGGDGGAGGNVNATQSASSDIAASGAANHGVFAYSRSGEAGNGGSGYAAPGGGTGGHSSDGGSVTVNQYGRVSTQGTGAYGIYALSVSNNGGNGGSQWGLVGEAGSGGYGGSGGPVAVNTFQNATILTSGGFSHGVLAQSVGGSGGSAGFSGNLLVSLIGQADNGGNGGTVAVSHGGAIQTQGDVSLGIVAQSIGGGGGMGGSAAGLVALGGIGSNGGSGNVVLVTVQGSGSILTGGAGSTGVLAQSIGGSGGNGGNSAGLVSIGGTGARAGDGNVVSVSSYGRIQTQGSSAEGIVAQSIGGGGGNGGSSAGMVSVGGSGAGGGSGNTVNVLNDGVIVTAGSDSTGIRAQSIGGGGGNGGSSGSIGLFAGVGIGGGGGAGGTGGTVNVTLSDTDSSQVSSIRTAGDRSVGVFAQSVGGGGGNGGGAVSVTAGFGAAAAVTVGGSGGSGGAGGTVNVAGAGSVAVQTGGADSAGLLLQSVGGGGGNGGYAVSTALAAGPVAGSIAVGVGGTGGSGGAGGTVSMGAIDGSGNLTAAGFSGSVLTEGLRSAGIVLQSIGGGGGNGGFSLAASGTGSLVFSGNISVSVGGSGGAASAGGTVKAWTASNVTTLGASSTAILAQSVGGGGGNGGGSIAAGLSASGGGAGSIGVGIGGSGGGGGNAGTLVLRVGGDNIETRGQFSSGVVAQAIGGGGGNGGYSVAASATAGGIGAGSVNVGIGGSAAAGGAGGAVDLQIDQGAIANSSIKTLAHDSAAVVAQSVGGGGGNGGFSVTGGAAGGGLGAGAVTVGLGGGGGAGGTGGSVTVLVDRAVETSGDRSSGIVSQSIGGGGGNGGFTVSAAVVGAGAGAGAVSVGLGGSGGTGGAGGSVNATARQAIETDGFASAGFVAQSIGGGGGNGGFSITPAIAGAGAGAGSVAVGLGGSGAGGGNGGSVIANTDGNITTRGIASGGIVAQSIGGGGGNGGFNVSAAISGAGAGSGAVSVGLGGSGAGGGDGGTVGLVAANDVRTEGALSSAVTVQSIGGGGGTGGFTVSVSGTGAGVGAGAIGVGLGGRGGTGGAGSAVTSDVTGNLTTLDSNSLGLLVQSVGGGGGNGGMNVTAAIAVAGTGSGGASVGLGGSAGGGGNAGTAYSELTGNVATSGEDSAGVVVQSLGGGGGNGGLSITGAVSVAGAGSGSASVGIGGSGGSGGLASSSEGRVSGDVTTLGNRSGGVLVQSLGGGGGNGGINVTGTVSGAGTGSGSVAVGIGGSGGGGGVADRATGTVTGVVRTEGADSAGVVVQSLGGGGGNGGLNVSGALNVSGGAGGGAGIGIGGFGGGGGAAAAALGTVVGNATTKLAVSTKGDRSGGVLVQSLGGGGGNGGLNVSGAASLSGASGGAIGFGLGGFGGSGGAAGTATGNVTYDVNTEGFDSAGVVVQSLGGGGGNGGLNVTGTLNVANSAGGGAAIGLGGFGGGGGSANEAKGTVLGNVSTKQDRSGGVLVQSLGGGGGNGGLNVSGAVSLSGGTGGAVAFGLGGFGGSGGTANTATGDVTGVVMTEGADSAGVVVQSVGGGGGNGGLNVSGTLTLTGSTGGGASIGIGGFGGDGGAAAAATGTVIGNATTKLAVSTKGDRSGGVLIQSLGGGGGNGGLNVSGALGLSGASGGAIGFGLGGFGGLGGAAGTATGSVTHNVFTEGADSVGIMVQSLGGGGGNGGLNVTGTLNVANTAGGAAAVGIGGFGGGGGNADTAMGDIEGLVLTKGNRSGGIAVQSLGGGGGNGGMNVSGGLSMAKSSSGALAFGLGGFGGNGGHSASVDNKFEGYVETLGIESIGILSQSLGGGGGNGGINVAGTVSLSRTTSGAASLGVGGFGGGGGDAGLLTKSDITGGVLTKGYRSAGIVTQSLGGGGGNGGLSVSGAIGLSMENGGAGAIGLGGFGGDGGSGKEVNSNIRTTTLYNSIVTQGDESAGVVAQSIGGAGGNGGVNVSGALNLTGKSGAAVAVGLGGFGGSGGDAGKVTLDLAGTVTTFGNKSHGVIAQSLGGGGGTGGTNVSGTLAVTKPSGSGTIFSVALGVGGFGGGGGDAEAVAVTYSGALTALPRDVSTNAIIQAEGADGLVAQSIGGGGGQGGINVSGGVAISSKPGEGVPSTKSYAVAVGVGGFGGVGGDAGKVEVDVLTGSTVRAHGTGRSGILAQSVGGGGGNGGLNVSGGIVSDTSFIVGVGGFGGNAGKAGDVRVTSRTPITVSTNPADIVDPTDASFEAKARSVLGDTVFDTIDEQAGAFGLKGLFVDLGLFKGPEAPETQGSAGLLAQSIGGGGGNGGMNVSGGIALSKDGKVPSITFGVGGFGGAGNVSGDVEADHAGEITVEGNWKHGIFAQSVAGGGGNGALNVTGQLNWGSSQGTDGATDLSITGGLGGTGGLGANSGDVLVISSGNITTMGYHARGLFAQSVGGGGGTGGINVTAVGTKDSTPVGLGIGGTGVAGGDAGDVTVTRGSATQAAGLIQTGGRGSHGIEASSIGGGGGDAGVNAVLGFSKTTGSQSDSGSGSSRKTPTNTSVDQSTISNYNAVLDELEGKSGTPDGTGGKKVNSAVIAIGGSAGNAGNGGDVTVTHFGNIITLDTGSHGVIAQSIGGGGGNGAFNLGLIFEAGQAERNRGFGLAIGGGTGAGGNGGKATLSNTGDVSTYGDDSHGLFAQSVGGGGGNAGYDSLTQSGEGGNVGITIGRVGGTGGTAGDVEVSSNGRVQTVGDRSHGVFGQSIGNGGGNSSSTSVNLSTPVKGDDKGEKFSLSLGLEGGLGGRAGNVNATVRNLVTTLGDDSHGVFAQSIGGGGGTGGSAISTPVAATSFSLNLGGNGGSGGVSGTVTVLSLATIETEGERSVGIMAQSVGGAGGTGGVVKSGSGIMDIAKSLKPGKVALGTTVAVNIGGDGGSGMTSGDVEVTSEGLVRTKGASAHGIQAQSVAGGGGNAGLIDNVIINVAGSIGSTATLSVGGIGGDGAKSGTVEVNNKNVIATSGSKAAGIFAQAVGGGGGDAQSIRNIVAGPDADNSSRLSLSFGGTGGTGGEGGSVTVRNQSLAQIGTTGEQSHGIFAQSVGGGGGNGSDVLSVSVTKPGSTAKMAQGMRLGLCGSGGTGGAGGLVEVVNNGLISTRGEKAHGILAQSVGGGGGNGGSSITGTLFLKTGTEADPTLVLNIGGAGGSGNKAGNVTVTNSGRIEVLGSKSFGVLAQSVGGGGGNGALAVALSLNNLADQARGKSYTNLAIGGAGGDGADAGNVTVNHSGVIVVGGDNAYGIFAQSVGGGGGTAGLSISTPLVMAADYVISTVLGARLGTKGSAGTVTVNNTGSIIITGAGSQAVFTQSVNGGGGTVDTFLDFTKDSSVSSASLEAAAGAMTSTRFVRENRLSLGGDDVDGTSGAAVSQVFTGDTWTKGDRSGGMILQSIGGGGGSAATVIKSGSDTDTSFISVLGAKNTDNAAGGAVTGARTGAVLTEGNFSVGGLTQSIGGGGGRMVIALDSGAAGAGVNTAEILLGADPSFLNHGGNIQLTLGGDTETLGNNASGQVVQSIGAGGGEVYLSGLDQASVTLGASDGSTGNGGNITLTNSGNTATSGSLSHGFVLQSIGGGGGLVSTDLASDKLTLTRSAANSGNGGAISFVNNGYILTQGSNAVAVLAQSLGGGGGAVDGILRGTAGGAGTGSAISLSLTGNIMALGEGGIAVMAQSSGLGGGGPVSVALGGVIIGGSGGIYNAERPSGSVPGAAGETSGIAAIVVDGGGSNQIMFSENSFLTSLNNRILSGGAGSETVTVRGTAVGNADLGGGVNTIEITEGGEFFAQQVVNLGASGLLRIDGDLYLGGAAYVTNGVLDIGMTATDLAVTRHVSETTNLTGSILFGATATYTPDVYFQADGAAGGKSDLIVASGNATIAGTVRPVLNLLERALPLVLIDAGGTVANNGTVVIGTPVLSYSIGLNGPTGDGSSIDLVVDPNFALPGMNRNERRTARHIDTVLEGGGSKNMGRLFALIANMTDEADVIDAISQLSSEDYAATIADSYYAGRRFTDELSLCHLRDSAVEMGDPRSCFWLSASGGREERDASREYRKFEGDYGNITGGVRAPVGDDLYVGIAGGYERVLLDDGDHFSATGDRLALAVSLLHYRGAFEMYGIVSGITTKYDAERFIGIAGVLPDGTPVSASEADADQRVNEAWLRLGMGYRYPLAGSAAYLRPGLDLDATYLHSNSADETGTDVGLVLKDTGQGIFAATPSLEIGTELDIGDESLLRGFLRAGFTVSSADTVFIDATFAGASSADGDFRNYSGIGSTVATVAGGLNLSLQDDKYQLGLSGRADWNEDFRDYSAGLNIGFRF